MTLHHFNVRSINKKKENVFSGESVSGNNIRRNIQELTLSEK